MKVKSEKKRRARHWVHTVPGSHGGHGGIICCRCAEFFGQDRRKGGGDSQEGSGKGFGQCYAIEGRYPPSVEYLEENYAVQINRKKYNVFYDGFASNVMPEITIIPIDE